MEVPIAMTVGAVATGAAFGYAVTEIEAAMEHGGILWVPVLGMASVTLLAGTVQAQSYALECADAERRGAELAALAREKKVRAAARAEAGTRWKRAAAAARADDCTTVRELDPQIRELDAELHAVVFARDAAIARCLASRE